MLIDPLLTLHTRLVQGDPSAPDLLANRLYGALLPWTQRAFRRGPPDVAADALTDAILEYLRVPRAFDPARRVPLVGFIRFATRRNVSNRLLIERRHRTRNANYSPPYPGHGVTREGGDDARMPSIAEALEAAENDIKQALREWLDGDHSLDPWRNVRSLQGIPASELRREAKRHKDAFIARLKRIARKQTAKRQAGNG